MGRPSLAEREAALNDSMGDDIKNRSKKGKGKKWFLTLADYEDVLFQKLLEGMKNKFDIIPFEVTMPENLPIEKRPKVGRLCYKVILWVHPNIGKNNSSVVCLKKNYGEPCPICEEIDALFAAGKTKDDEEVNSLFATRKAIYNTRDYNDVENINIIKLLIASGAKFDDELMEAAFNDHYNPNDPNDKEFEPFANLTNGSTLEFKGIKDGFKNKKGEYVPYLNFTKFAFLKRQKPYTEEVLKQVYPIDRMIVKLSYDEILALHLNKSIDDEETNTTTNTPQPEKTVNSDNNQTPDKSFEKEANETVEQVTNGPTESENKVYGKCPNGYNFGYECDKSEHIDECNSCSEWDACEDANREIRKAERANLTK